MVASFQLMKRPLCQIFSVGVSMLHYISEGLFYASTARVLWNPDRDLGRQRLGCDRMGRSQAGLSPEAWFQSLQQTGRRDARPGKLQAGPATVRGGEEPVPSGLRAENRSEAGSRAGR